MVRILRQPSTWFAAIFCWSALLWFLSSRQGSPMPPPPVPHLDKLAHFIYFLGGGFLLAGWGFRRNPERPSWKPILGITIVVMASIGWIDEWHQTFTPGRSGLDPWDWLADLLGATAGAFILKAVHRRL